MGRLIEADALILEICKRKGCFATGEGNEPFMAWEVEDYINDAPTVDAVPVVRCKDCVNACRTASDGMVFPLSCYIHGFDVEPDDFCSYGERKEDTP